MSILATISAPAILNIMWLLCTSDRPIFTAALRKPKKESIGFCRRKKGLYSCMNIMSFRRVNRYFHFSDCNRRLRQSYSVMYIKQHIDCRQRVIFMRQLSTFLCIQSLKKVTVTLYTQTMFPFILRSLTLAYRTNKCHKVHLLKFINRLSQLKVHKCKNVIIFWSNNFFTRVLSVFSGKRTLFGWANKKADVEWNFGV